MTKEMYKAQYRKEIYARTMQIYRMWRVTPIIEIRQGELTTVMWEKDYFIGALSIEQKAAFDEIAAEFDAEWNAYRAHQIDHL